MDAFGVLDEVLDDYESFVKGFLDIKDDQIRAKVEGEIEDGLLWPEPWLALNPAFEPGGTVSDLAELQTLNKQAEQIFRIKASGDHIVIDEAQDLSPDKWRLLRAAVAEAHNDMFIAGDTHQRIYDSRVSFREVGVNIAGRTSRLKLNYRTTAEILGWSLGLLRGERIEDMEGELSSIAGCKSYVHGSPPTLHDFDGADAETKFIAGSVNDSLAGGVKPAEIGIAARTKWFGGKIEKALKAAGIKTVDLARTKRPENAVRVGTMHRMKGLEFRCVGVAGVSAKQVPAAVAVTPIEEDKRTHDHDHDLERERCLLFVACTRAREELLVTWHGEASPFLTAITADSVGAQ
jgi:superfamily I DNA/RNA helicase